MQKFLLYGITRLRLSREWINIEHPYLDQHLSAQHLSVQHPKAVQNIQQILIIGNIEQ